MKGNREYDRARQEPGPKNNTYDNVKVAPQSKSGYDNITPINIKQNQQPAASAYNNLSPTKSSGSISRAPISAPTTNTKSATSSSSNPASTVLAGLGANVANPYADLDFEEDFGDGDFFGYLDVNHDEQYLDVKQSN